MNISLKLSSREQTNDSTSANKMYGGWQFDNMRFSTHVNLLFFYLEIQSFFDYTTVEIVNTE